MKSYSNSGEYVYFHSYPNYRIVIPEGESIESVQVYTYILECIVDLFHALIPDISTRPLTVVIKHGNDYPQCRRDLETIYLDTHPSFYSQIAYQFSHEYCHYVNLNRIYKPLRWFEESICETASLYFLHLLANYWTQMGETIRDAQGNLYANHFAEYATHTAFNFVSFDLTSPNEMKYLADNCYDRRKNRYLANKLMPIFSKYPAAWEAITSLHRIQESDLHQALSAWIQLAPASSRPGLKQIQNLFVPHTQHPAPPADPNHLSST